MIRHLSDKRIILASKSPRRKELIQGLGLEFVVQTKAVNEDFPATMEVTEVAKYLAEKKAAAFKGSLQANDLLITADTVVIIQGEILNKPQNKQEALQMLRRLSGRVHQVRTGVCLLDQKKTVSFDDCTAVHLKNMDQEELHGYIDKYQPYDKAGAYGVQEWIGYVAVYKIIGSFYNVMGLPVHRVYEELKKW